MPKQPQPRIQVPHFASPLDALETLEPEVAKDLRTTLVMATEVINRLNHYIGTTRPDVPSAVLQGIHDEIDQAAGTAVYNHLVTRYPHLGRRLGPGVERRGEVMHLVADSIEGFDPERFRKLDTRLDTRAKELDRLRKAGPDMAAKRQLPYVDEDLRGISEKVLDRADAILANERKKRTPSEEKERFRQIVRRLLKEEDS